MFLKLNRLVLVPAIAVGALALPAGASAAVYCVDMGAACPASGVASATLTAALASTNAAADEDWIYLGATTQAVTEASVNGNRPTHIVGSGRDVSRINTTQGIAAGMTINGPGSSIESVTVANTQVNGTTLALSGPGASLDRGTGRSVARNVRVLGTSGTAVILNDGGTLVGSEVVADMTGLATAVRASGSSGAAPMVVRASILRGAYGVRAGVASEVLAERNTITYSVVGVRSEANNQAFSAGEPTLRVRDCVLKLEAQGAGATSTVAFDAFAQTVVEANANDSAVATATIDARGVTVIGTGQTSGIGIDTVASASSDATAGPGAFPVGHVAVAAVRLDEVAVVGAFDQSAVRIESTDGAWEDSTSYVRIERSNIDLSPARVATNGDPVPDGELVPSGNTPTVFWRQDLGFVDAGAGDYRIVGSSPLVDVGGPEDESERGSDLGGSARPRSAPDAATPKFDIGAFEYQWTPPSVTATGPTGAIAPGGSVTVTAAGTDADPGESAQLTYAWALPGGVAATGAAATFAAPTAPGLHVATVTVTDPAGIKTSVPVAFSVGVAPYVAPADTHAPMVQFGKLKASLATLLKRKAASFKLELSEAATVRASAVVTVRQPAKKRGGKPKLVKLTVGASLPTALPAGVGTIKLTASKNGAALLAKALKVRGAKVASTMLVGTVADPSGNKRAFSNPVAITK